MAFNIQKALEIAPENEIARFLSEKKGADYEDLSSKYSDSEIVSQLLGMDQSQYKDVSQRALNKTSMGDFERGVAQSWEGSKSALGGMAALGGAALKGAGAEEVGQKVQDYGMNVFKKHEQTASLYPTTHLGDVDSVGSGIDFAQGLLGSTIVSMGEVAATAALSGGGGYAIGKTLVKKGADAAVKKAILNKAVKTGTKIGIGASVYPLETGSMYGGLKAQGVDAPVSSAIFGGLSTALEYVGGNSKVANQLVDAIITGKGAVAKKAARELLSFKREALSNIRDESLQELGQGTLELLNTVINTDEKFLTKENMLNLTEQAIGGAIGGVFGATTSSALKAPNVFRKDEATPTPPPTTEPPKNTSPGPDLVEPTQSSESPIVEPGDLTPRVYNDPTASRPVIPNNQPSGMNPANVFNQSRENILPPIVGAKDTQHLVPPQEPVSITRPTQPQEEPIAPVIAQDYVPGEDASEVDTATPAELIDSYEQAKEDRYWQSVKKDIERQRKEKLTKEQEARAYRASQQLGIDSDQFGAYLDSVFADEEAIAPQGRHTPPVVDSKTPVDEPQAEQGLTDEQQPGYGDYKTDHIDDETSRTIAKSLPGSEYLDNMSMGYKNTFGVNKAFYDKILKENQLEDTSTDEHIHVKGDNSPRTIESLIHDIKSKGDWINGSVGMIKAGGKAARHPSASPTKIVSSFSQSAKYSVALEEWKQQHPEGWKAYIERQIAVSKLEKGDPVIAPYGTRSTPDGSIYEIVRKNKKTWTLTEPGRPGSKLLVAPEALRPVEKTPDNPPAASDASAPSGVISGQPSPGLSTMPTVGKTKLAPSVQDAPISELDGIDKVRSAVDIHGKAIQKWYGLTISGTRAAVAAYRNGEDITMQEAQDRGDAIDAERNRAREHAFSEEGKAESDKKEAARVKAMQDEKNNAFKDNDGNSITPGEYVDSETGLRFEVVKSERGFIIHSGPDAGNMRPFGAFLDGNADQNAVGFASELKRGSIFKSTKSAPSEKQVGTKSDVSTPTGQPAITPLKDKTMQAHIDKRVERLGSIEAVDKDYAGDDKVSAYARSKAREVYSGGLDKPKGTINDLKPLADALHLEGEENGMAANAVDVAKRYFGLKPSDMNLDQLVNELKKYGIDQKGGLKNIHDHFYPAKPTKSKETTLTRLQAERKKESEAKAEQKQPVKKGIQGKKGTSYLSDGTSIDFEYEVVPLESLVASHDENMNVNPEYPADLQPRARGRKASILQVDNIASKLKPELLGSDTSISKGAPMVSPDSNVVESGNGRTLALGKALKGEKGALYQEWLKKNATEFGIDHSKIEGMKNPVLIRRRISQVDDVAKFTQMANKSDVAAMSVTEQAKVDADNMTQDDLSLFRPDQDGNITAASNKTFVDRFINGLTIEERSAYLMEDGRLNKQGVDRIQAAIFQKAYGSQELLSLAAEESDPDIKNILNGLTASAGSFAKARGLSEGLNGVTIVEDIVDAINLLRTAQRDYKDIMSGNGNSKLLNQLRQFFSQQDMFGEAPDSNQKDIAFILAKNIRSGKRIGEFLDYMAVAVKTHIADLSQMEMFGIKEEITNAKLVFMSKQKLEEKYEQKERDLFPEEETKPDAGSDNKRGRTIGQQPGRTGTRYKNAEGDRLQEVNERFEGSLFDEDPKKSKQLELFPAVPRHGSTRKTGQESKNQKAGSGNTENRPDGLRQNVKVGVRTTGNLEYHGLNARTNGDIAALLSNLIDSPQERLYTVAVDKNGTIIEVLDYSKGGKSTATAIPGEIAGRIFTHKNTDRVYFVHNHPAGSTTPSPEDQNVLEKLTKILSLRKIKTEAIILGMTDDGKRVYRDFGIKSWERGDERFIPQTVSKTKIPIKERVFIDRKPGKVNINSPNTLESHLKGRPSGFLFADTKNKEVGFLELPVGMPKREIGALLVDVADKTNARAVFMYSKEGDINGRMDFFKDLAGVMRTSYVEPYDMVFGDVNAGPAIHNTDRTTDSNAAFRGVNQNTPQYSTVPGEKDSKSQNISKGSNVIITTKAAASGKAYGKKGTVKRVWNKAAGIYMVSVDGLKGDFMLSASEMKLVGKPEPFKRIDVADNKKRVDSYLNKNRNELDDLEWRYAKPGEMFQRVVWDKIGDGKLEPNTPDVTGLPEGEGVSTLHVSSEPQNWGKLLSEEYDRGGKFRIIEIEAMDGDIVIEDPQQAMPSDMFGRTLDSNVLITGRPELKRRKDKTYYQITYHGTPHEWQAEPGFPYGRPRLDKIGTGEGAQAYGHGWYSADSYGVASNYNQDVINDEWRDDIWEMAIEYTKGYVADLPVKSGQKIKETVVGNIKETIANEDGQKAIAFAEELLSAASKMDSSKFTFKDGVIYYGSTPFEMFFGEETGYLSAGNIYKLDIPDKVIPQLLDWDKPISEQTDYVKKAIEPLVEHWKNKGASDEAVNSWRGEQIYDRAFGVAQKNGFKSKDRQVAASEYLASIGIPGNKYLDGMSRSKGEGSYNYVLWDQNVLDQVALLERNGEKILEAQNKTTTQQSEKPITPQKVEKYFKSLGLQTGTTKDGKLWVRAPGGLGFTVETVNRFSDKEYEIAINSGAMDKTGHIAGNLVGHNIKVSSEFGDKQTLDHELTHLLENAGILTKKEVFLLTAKARQYAKNNPKFKLQADGRENRANFLSQVLTDREKYRGTPLGKVLQKIADFIDALVHIGRASVRKIARGMETGEIYGRKGKPVAGIEPQNQTKRNTETPAFKRWFGDSKVVDENGDPLVVYHGTHSVISQFEHAEKSHFGFHFGDQEAANTRLEDTADGKVDKADLDRQKAMAQENFRKWREFEDSLTAKKKDIPENVLLSALENNEDLGEIFEKYAYKPTKEESKKLSRLKEKYNNSKTPINPLGIGANVGLYYIAIENPLRTQDVGNWGSVEDIKKKLPFDSDSETLGELKSDIIDRGYDGIVYQNIVENPVMRTDSYIAFNPTQIKSVYNQGAWNPEDPRIQYSTTTPDPFSMNPDSTRFEDFKYHVVDVLNPVEKLYKSINKAIPEDSDFLLKERLRTSVAKDRIEQSGEKYFKPIEKLIGENGLTVANVDEALYARHAPEANARLRLTNARYFLNKLAKAQKGGKLKKKLKELDAKFELEQFPTKEIQEGYFNILESELANATTDEELAVADRWNAFKEKPSGMTDDTAKELNDKWKDNQAMKDIFKLFDAMNDESLKISYDAGRMSKDEYQAIKGTFDYYAPLHREGFENKRGRGTGRGLTNLGKDFMARGGSTKPAVNLLANAIISHEKNIVRAEKAEVSRAFMKFVKENPNDEFWGIKQAKTKAEYDAHGNIRRRVDQAINDNEVQVKVDGKSHLIYVNENNVHAMRMLDTIKGNDDNVGPIVNALSSFNRVLATINTSLNPEFVLSNLIRDSQTAFFNLSDTDVAKMKRQIFKDMPKSLAALRSVMRGDKSHEWADIVKLYRSSGGQTGWMSYDKTIGTRVKKIEGTIDLSRPGHKTKKAINSIIKFVEDYNSIAENAVRLSAFKAGIDSGMTPAKSAMMAKGLTVNFTQKGKSGQIVNSLYLFANAGIQGSTRLITAIHKSPKVRKLVAGSVVAAVGLSMANRGIGGDDDDGVPYYEQIDDYVKSRNMIFMIPGGNGKYVKIPLPWGYNVFWSLGTELGDAALSKNYDALEGAARMTTTVADAFNPLQSSTILQMLSPTIGDPFVQVGENKTFFGSPLMPDNNSFVRPQKPDSERYWESARNPSKAFAKWINTATGGDSVTPGMVDISPETIDLVIDTFTGGSGRFFVDTISIPFNIAMGENELRKTPVARRFVGDKSEYMVSEDYAKNTEHIYRLQESMKVYPKRRAEIRKDRAYLMSGLMEKTEKEIRKLHKLEKISNSSDHKRLILGKIKKAKKRFNQEFSKYK